ncbi:MAG: SWIM zinc finger family protein [Conexivisphaera sp.]
MRVARVTFIPSGLHLWASGSALEYLVSLDPPMCTCPDFSFRLARGTPSPCKHIRSVLASKYWGTYEEITLPDDQLIGVLIGSMPIQPRTSEHSGLPPKS